MPIKVTKVTGGDKYKGLLAEIAKQKVGVKAGILADATTTEGKGIAEYAIYNEFGTAAIPARPFMRQTVEKSKGKWIKTVEQLMGRNPGNARDAMFVVGEVMRGDIVYEIQNGSFAANAASTVAAKERKGKVEPDHPLIDTGQMMKAVSYEVVDK